MDYQYIGRVCEVLGNPSVIPNWGGLWTIETGQNFHFDYGDQWCNYQRTGVLDANYSTFNGYKTGIRNGVFNYLNIYNGFETGNFKNVSGQYTGTASISNTANLKVSNTGVIFGSGSGTINGLISGNLNGFYPQIQGWHTVNYAVNGPFSMPGYTSGITINITGDVTISGTGSFNQLNSNWNQWILSGGQSGIRASSGYFAFTGYMLSDGFSGSSQEISLASRSESFSGVEAFICDATDSPTISSLFGCPSFPGLSSNCSFGGGLDVRILYPTTGSSFTIKTINPNVPTYSGIQITAVGDIYYAPTDPRPTGNTTGTSGIQDNNVTCPYYEAISPTCTGGNDGSITFILENTDPTQCQIQPPYSGVVSNGDDILYTGYPVPARLTFNKLYEGTYQLDISGVTGVMSIPVEIDAQGAFGVNVAIIKKPTSCGSSDGVVRFSWSGYSGASVPWNLTDTNFSGTSPTGTTVSGLLPASYNLHVDQNRFCSNDTQFDLGESNPVIVNLIGRTGATCLNNLNDGRLLVQASGGHAPYTYKWLNVSGNNFTNYATGLSPGFYSISVTDASGCNYVDSFLVPLNNNNLSVNSFFISGGPLLCCQENTNFPAIKVVPQGGTAPYTYAWNTTPVHTGNILSGVRAGSYYCTVTDANGCSVTTSSQDISYVYNCFKVRWTSTDGVTTQQKEFFALPSDIPTSIPFTYNKPGDYLIKLAIANQSGQQGIDCTNIHIVKESGSPIGGSPNPFPGPPIPSGSNPSPTGIPPGGGGGFPPDGGGPPTDPTHTPRSVCCQLLNAGVNDTSCATNCSEDPSLCNGANAVFGGAQQVVNAPCSNCNGIWTPKQGVCCIPKNDGTSDCRQITSCDGPTACKRYDENATWYEGGTCDTSSSNYSCGSVGLCCTDQGTIGKACQGGNMSEKQCTQKGGQFLAGAKTCQDAGSVHDGKTWCTLYNGVCCVKYAQNQGGGNCGTCFESDYYSCRDYAQNLGISAGFNWTYIPDEFGVDGPATPNCANTCKTDCGCEGYGEDGCQCDGRHALGLGCCCGLGEAPNGPNGSCVSMPCGDTS